MVAAPFFPHAVDPNPSGTSWRHQCDSVCYVWTSDLANIILQRRLKFDCMAVESITGWFSRARTRADLEGEPLNDVLAVIGMTSVNYR